MHLVITVADLWFREFRHRFVPVFTERRFVLCELKVELEVMTEDIRKHSTGIGKRLKS